VSTFKAIVIDKMEVGQTVRLTDFDERDLMDGDVTVAVEYSTLNYKDGLALTGRSPVVRRFPMIAGIDLAGTVKSSSHPAWKEGDKVVLNGWGLGESHLGAYAEVARVKGDWLVRLPSNMSAHEAMAIGTAGYTAMLSVMALERAGVALNAKGAIEVDDYSRSSVANIYAVGDVTDRVNLTPVAIAEGQAFAETVYNDNPTKPDHAGVPSAVFSDPELATVGLTEEAARRAFGAVDVYRTSFRALKHTLSGRSERTMMKLVVERAGGKVVGAHMVGEGAAEIIQGLAVALKAGATKCHFDRTIGIHPTAAEEFVTMRTPVPAPEKQAAE